MYCTNCRTGFNWVTGVKIEKYFENPERTNILSRDNNYVEMNEDVREMYESESYEFVVDLYDEIVKHKSELLDSINTILQSKSHLDIVNFMDCYINYKYNLLKIYKPI